MIIAIDTYAWIEYFEGTVKGKKVSSIIEDKNNILITLECCLYEFKIWCLRNKLDFNKLVSIIKQDSEVKHVSLDLWLEASNIRYNFGEDLSVVDSLIMAYQKKILCKVLTGDKHFKELKNVIFLE